MPVKRITVFDIILIILLLAAAVAVLPFLRSHQPARVVVYRFDDVAASYPLDRDKEFSIEGVEGPVRVRIHKKTASVVASTCHNQICVHSPSISSAGSQIVCAPNRIIVIIESNTRQPDTDAITQ